MAAEDVGSILYTVEMDVRNLITSERLASDRLDRLEGNLNRTADSASGLGAAVSKMAGAIAAALSIQKIVEYANAWVDVSNKLANSRRELEGSAKSNEALADVLGRVFKVSQDSRSELEATATLYSRLERATRSAGTSTADLATLTTTINKAFVVSGASADEAAGAILQLSQGLASGVLRGDEFNTIMESGSRLAQAIADSLGVTTGQLRAMAAQGALTTDVIVNGLLGQADVIAKEFGNTVLTMGQAFTIANNNITKFVGENSSVITSLNVFNQAVVAVSQNLDVVANLIGVVAVGALARFSGAMAASLASRMADTAAALAQARATSAAAAAQATAATITARKSMLDKEAALSSLALAQAEYNVAKGSAAEAFALENLNAVKSIAIQRSAAFTEAQIAQAAATRTASTAAAAATTTVGGLARGALALIGGPAGAAVIAGAAIFYFFQKAQQAKQESIDFADKLDGLIGKMKEMSQIQLAAEIDKANKSIAVQNGELSTNEATLAGLNVRLEAARKAVKDLGEDSLLYSGAVSNLNTLESESIQLTAQVERERNKLSQTISKTGILQAQANGTFAQGIDLLKRDGHEAGVAAGLFNQLGDALNVAAKAKDNFNSQSLRVGITKDGQKQLDQLTQENELLQITDKRLRAVKSARLDAINAGEGNQNVINQVGELAGANYDLQQAEAARNKAAKAGAKTEDEGAKKIADLQRQLEYLKLSYDENSREAAVYNAVQSAGSKATELQKQAIGEYAGALFDAKQKQADLNAAIAADPVRNADKTYSDATKQLKRQLDEGIVDQQQFNQESLKLAQDHANDIAKANANSVVTPAAEAAGTVDPVQQLANENAQKLALIQQFEANKTITEQQGIALRNAANTQYDKARTDAMWQLWSQQSAVNGLLASGFETLASSGADAFVGVIDGSMSATDALKSVGEALLKNVISSLIQMGVQYAMNAILANSSIAAITATSSAAAGTLAAAWAPAAAAASLASFGANAVPAAAGITSTYALASGLSSTGLAGARKNGGPVTAGGTYQVGEGGAPELYQGANGRQYMIPGDNGSVISNKDLGTSGTGATGSNVSVNVHNYGSSQVQTNQSTAADGTLTIDMVLSDFQEGGPLSQGIANNFTTKRKATQ